MSLQVPPDQVVILKAWLELPKEKVAAFSAALEQAAPQFNAPELAKTLIPHSDLSPGLVFGIVDVLISVYRTGAPQKPFDAFLDREVRPALARAKMFSQESQEREWGTLREFLFHALSLENIIGTTAKAGDVLTENERIFNSARIMTDFRPIFHVDASELPNAGVIVHILRITQRDRHGHQKDICYALDINDVLNLRNILDRAAEKESVIRSVMDKTGITTLHVESFY
jgi:hypothetical protein